MRQHTDAGFSLVEVLVSLLVLSVGIIGAASMQLTALRNNQQSGFHSIGLQVATEIADQIRIMSISNIGGGGNPLLSLDFKSNDAVAVPPTLCYGDAPGCDDMALLAVTIHQAQSRIVQQLPDGRIKICRDAWPWDDSGNSYTWDCGADNNTGPIAIKLGWRAIQDGSSAVGTGANKVAPPQLVLIVQS